MSNIIDLAAEYLQRDLDKLARWCAKWRRKLNPEKTKVIIFSESRSTIRAEPALSLYSDLLLYYPHIKFLGITFDSGMTFTKQFEEILERWDRKFHCLRILVNKKWGPSPATIVQIYKQCVRPTFQYGIVSMLSILKMLSLFSGSKGPHGPDLPSPYGRKFSISLHALPCHYHTLPNPHFTYILF